jgi:hypothetical protein
MRLRIASIDATRRTDHYRTAIQTRMCNTPKINSPALPPNVGVFLWLCEGVTIGRAGASMSKEVICGVLAMPFAALVYYDYFDS